MIGERLSGQQGDAFAEVAVEIQNKLSGLINRITGEAAGREAEEE